MRLSSDDVGLSSDDIGLSSDDIGLSSDDISLSFLTLEKHLLIREIEIKNKKKIKNCIILFYKKTLFVLIKRNNYAN